MPVMNPSLCIGAQPLVYLPPRSTLPANGKFHGRYYPTRASMQFQPLRQRKFPSLKAVGSGSNSKRSVFACNAALSRAITQAPTHGKEKSPKLDDGGSGFPPRDDGGGGGGGGAGGGGGGGESFSGGFFLFGFLMFMGYLKIWRANMNRATKGGKKHDEQVFSERN